MRMSTIVELSPVAVRPTRLALSSPARFRMLRCTLGGQGTLIAERPPHRSRRALLTHRASPSGSGVCGASNLIGDGGCADPPPFDPTCGGRRRGRQDHGPSTELAALCACSGWECWIGKTGSPRSILLDQRFAFRPSSNSYLLSSSGPCHRRNQTQGQCRHGRQVGPCPHDRLAEVVTKLVPTCCRR
jgi:hypothetical protein